jgi:hypothetical protein
MPDEVVPRLFKRWRRDSQRNVHAIGNVEDADTHPPEDRDPLVALDLIVGETIDLVVHPAPMEGGNREHVFAPSLQSHGKLLHRHLRQHGRAACAPGGWRGDTCDAEREHAAPDAAHGAPRSLVVGRRLECESAAHLPVDRPLLPLRRRLVVLVRARCLGLAQEGRGDSPGSRACLARVDGVGNTAPAR